MQHIVSAPPVLLQEAVHKRTASSGSVMGGSAPTADGGSGGGGGAGGIFHRVSSIKNMLTGQSSKCAVLAGCWAAVGHCSAHGCSVLL